MLCDKTVAVVVPAYNEEKQIGQVLETMPKFVDRIIVVNDCSKDNTAAIVLDYISKHQSVRQITKNDVTAPLDNKYDRAEHLLKESRQTELEKFIPAEIANVNYKTHRVILINNLKNGGVGAAIASGYKWCLDHNIDCTASRDGDGQMDPAELESICQPIVNEEVDCVKGNRLIHGSAPMIIPRTRYFGNAILSILTKIASGYWHISDTQCGYRALSLAALSSIKLHDIYKSYGMPNDILIKLNIAFCTLKEVKITSLVFAGKSVSAATMLAFFFLFTSSFQSLLFAMWMDIQDNERLYK